jgi:hypothetical protein
VLAPLLAAACFVAAPYPFLTNLYVRGAVPEALALGLLPWLLVAGDGAWRWGGGWVLALAGIVAAVMLVHNLTSLVAVLLLTGWLGARFLAGDAAQAHNPGAARRAAGGVLLALALGFGLSALFWLPAVAETRYVQIDLAQGGLFDFRHWLFDVVSPRAEPAYPHTPLGPADLHLRFDYSAIGKTLPEKPSLGQLLAWCLAVVAPLLTLSAVGGRGERPRALRAWGWAAAATACWVLNTTWSAWLWQHIGPLSLVQFPWRLYGPMALCLAIALGVAASGTYRAGFVTCSLQILGVVCVLLLAYGSLAQRPVPLGPFPAHDIDERSLSALETDRYGAGTTSGGEFLPRTVGWPEFPDGTKAGIRLYDRAFPESSWQAGLARVLSGDAAITGIYQQPRWLAADVIAQDSTEIAFHQLVFPGWRAFVDGHRVPIAPAQVPLVDPKTGMTVGTASLGFATVPVPAGRHRVEVRFGPTRIRLAADAITAGTLAALALFALWWCARGFDASLTAGARPLRQTLAAGAAWCGAAALVAWWGYTQSGPVQRVPPEAARVVLDVISASDASAVRSFVDGNGLPRRSLTAAVPSRMALPVRLPPHAFLQTGLGPQSSMASRSSGAADGIRFTVDVEGAAGRRTVLDQTSRTEGWSGASGWSDVWIDLESLAGQDVEITLAAEPLGATADSATWAAWANPQIVRWTSHARPYPGTQHLW